jgi:hypothetical protein
LPAREPTARQGIRLAALGGSAALAAGALLVGGVLAGSLTASAASSSTGASAATSQSRAAAGKASTQQSRATFPAHGTPAHENLEKPVTGSAADKARAAAVKRPWAVARPVR